MRSMSIALAFALLCGPSLAKDEPEFDGACAYGLSEGVVFKTDCSVTWTNPKTHKTYCFSSEQSKEAFLDDLEANLRKAQEKSGELHKN
jgi:hypothetical protein